MKKLLFLVATLLLAAGCGPSSKITSSWTPAGIQPRDFRKVMVVGIIRDSDRSLREKMEQHLLSELRGMGYEAVCSCDEYGPKAFENMGEQEVIAKLRGSGVDAVMTVVLLDKQRERYYVPGRVNYTPYMVYYNRFWHYSRTVYGRIYTEGYYADDTRYFWETNLYDLNAPEQLLYSAQSQSFDPSSSETLGHEYGQMIVKDLVKHQVLYDRKNTPQLKAM